jgi:hypothetical protein
MRFKIKCYSEKEANKLYDLCSRFFIDDTFETGNIHQDGRTVKIEIKRWD